MLGVFTMLTLFMLVFSMVLPQLAAADSNSETFTDIQTVDSYSGSGCTNDNTIYVSADYGIKLEQGWCKIDMDDWTTADTSFQLYFAAVGDTLELLIEDDEDSNNYIEIVIKCYSATETEVKITDHYGGESPTKTERKTADTETTWGLVDIDIARTAKTTDGSTTQISVSVANVEFFDEYVLLSGEWSFSAKQRNLNSWTWTSKTTSDVVYIDDGDIDTNGAVNRGYNTHIIIVVVVLVAVVVAWKFDITPLNKKGWVRRKLGK